ncbi:MAG: aminotransferase class I/II-fold pyridoxal phosphate-dependent enzyme [Mycobacterium sp.]|nr:aminotransferase class I/II-fold pyridoxal phosphate-dependent enzyme [Mycobacterium sp.]
MKLTPAQDSVLTTVDRWTNQQTYPFFPVVAQASSTRATLDDGRELVVFGSADYLGLSRHPAVIDGAVEAVRKFGASLYGVQASSGFTTLHRDLAAALAKYFGHPEAALFPTGMQANFGTMAALFGPGDEVFCDQYNHSSIMLGARLSGAKVVTFRHNNMEHLESLLRNSSGRGNRGIIVDGLFSADGDYAALGRIAELADDHGLLLIVDEAHAAGAVGNAGRGAAELAGISERVDVITGTLSKAFGGVGGFAVGQRTTINLIRHTAAAYLLSVGLAPATVGAALVAVQIASGPEGSVRRSALDDNARLLRHRLVDAGARIGTSTSHIVPVLTCEVDRTVTVATWLRDHGLMANPLVPPAVPIGAARLRLGVLSDHDQADIDMAASLIEHALEQHS